MRTRMVVTLALALLWVAGAAAQQLQPLVVVADYHIRPGKEEEFVNLVKTVGGPVRDKLMAEGVVFGWGLDVPVMRAPGGPTHSVWYTVAGWDGVEKVQTALRARLESLAAEEKKAAEEARRKRQPVAKTTAERVEEIWDSSKTKDWVFREVVTHYSSTLPPADLLPYTRIFVFTVKPGKFGEYRELWDKYNKPLLGRLIAEGVIGGYSIGFEEVRTSGEFTHYVAVGIPNLAAGEKVRNAFVADRNRRSQEEQDHIVASFNRVTDPDAGRSFILRSVIFKVAPPPK